MRKLAAAAISAFVVFASVVSACGGETPAPNNNPQNDAAAPPVSASATASAAPEQDAGPPAIDAQRDPFIAVCLRSVPSQAYCACTWDQYREARKGEADPTQAPTQDVLLSIKQKTLQSCAPKLTDADVKPAFTSACVGNESKKQPFCDCEWTELRKKLDPPDFVTDFTGTKFDDAKKAMAKACKGKLPDDLAKKDFMNGCTKAAPGKDKACECMWKKIRAKASAEEIAADVVDVKSFGVESCLKQ